MNMILCYSQFLLASSDRLDADVIDAKMNDGLIFCCRAFIGAVEEALRDTRVRRRDRRAREGLCQWRLPEGGSPMLIHLKASKGAKIKSAV